MATLEELVVSLVAETSGLRAELDKATKATTGATDKMDKAIQEFSKNGSEGLGFFQTAMATMTGFIGSQAVLGAFNLLKDAASTAFETLIVDGVRASIETENAMNKLNNAMALSGTYSRQASEEMVKLANALQETTTYGDDAVLTAGSIIQTIGKLGANELPKATQATVDLAAALSIDLDSAAKLVGKAANGSTDAFKRYGIVIEEGKTKTETFNNTLAALARFQGTAAQQAKTYSGQLTIMENAFSDLTKIFGEAFIKNQAVLNIMTSVNKMILETTDSLGSNKNAFAVLIAEGLVMMIQTLGTVTAMLDIFVRSVQFLTGVALALTSPLFLIIAGLEALTNGLDAGKAVMDDWAKSMIEDFNAFGESGDGVLHGMTTKFAEVGVAAETGLSAVRAGMEATVEPTNKATESIVAMTEAEQARIDKVTAFTEGLAEQTGSIEENYAYQLELLQNAREAEALTDEEYFAAKLEVMTAQQEAELALLEQYHALKGSNDKKYIDAKTALEKKHTLENAKQQKERLEYEKLTSKEREANLKSSLQTIASLSSSGNKTLAAIGKAAAISTATMDGYAAVQKALASAPPPYNFALAAAVGVATAANIAKISGVALNRGGTVPGGGPNRDSVPAMLTPGEEVVNRDTANQLRDFLSNQGGPGGSMKIEISLKDDLIEFIEAKIIERQRLGTSLLGST